MQRPKGTFFEQFKLETCAIPVTHGITLVIATMSYHYCQNVVDDARKLCKWGHLVFMKAMFHTLFRLLIYTVS